MGFGVCTVVVVLEITRRVLIQIFRLNLIVVAVCVLTRSAPLTLDMFIVKFVHQYF